MSCAAFLAGFLVWRRARERPAKPLGLRPAASRRAWRSRAWLLAPYCLAACAGLSLAMARGCAILDSPLRAATGQPDVELGFDVLVTGLVRTSGDLVLAPARVLAVRGRPAVQAPLRDALELRIAVDPASGETAEAKTLLPRPGDVLSVLGRLYLPGPQMNPYEQDVRRALVRSGVAARCAVTEYAFTPRRGLAAVAATIYAPLRIAQWCRDRLIAVLETGLSPPSAGLARSFLLGDKTGLGADERTAFERTGSLHLLAVSGLHAGLFAGFIGWLANLCRLTGRGRAAITSAALGAYVLVTGSSPAVLRAAVMAWSAMWRPASRTGGDAVGYLGAAGSVLLLLDPLSAGEVSFQLSFLATLGIVSWPRSLAAPRHGTFPSRLPPAILRGLTAGLGAQVCTLPVVLHCFHRFCPYAPVAGLVLLPAGGAVIFVLFGAVAAGLICPAVFGWIGWAVDLMLRAFIWLVRLLSAMPGALATTGYPAPAISVAALAVILWASLLAARGVPHPRMGSPGQDAAGSSAVSPPSGRRVRPGPALAPCGGPLIALAAAALLCGQAVAWHSPAKGVSVAWFSVGQGDAALVRCGRQAVLVDFGPPGPPGWEGGDQFSKVVLPYLTATRCRPSFGILSHPHADHIGGLSQAMRAFPEMVVITRQEFAAQVSQWTAADPPSPLPWPPPDNLVYLAETHACLELGDSLSGFTGPGAGEARIELFAAPDGPAGENLNDRSLVARVVVGLVPAAGAANQGGSAKTGATALVLFAGDLGEEAESRLLASLNLSLRAEVLKVAHHGSGGSSSAAFLHEVRPRLAVVSVGVNGFGHPSRAALSRLRDQGALVLRTDEVGWVQIRPSGGQLRVEVFRGGVLRQGTGSIPKELTTGEDEGCRGAVHGLTPRPRRGFVPGKSRPCTLCGGTPICAAG